MTRVPPWNKRWQCWKQRSNQHTSAYQQHGCGQHEAAAQDHTDRAQQRTNSKRANARRTPCWTGFFAAFTLGANQQPNAECDTQAEKSGLICRAGNFDAPEKLTPSCDLCFTSADDHAIEPATNH